MDVNRFKNAEGRITDSMSQGYSTRLNDDCFYFQIDEEAKEVFDDFASNKVIWVEPNGNLIWEETLEKQVTNAGLEYDEEDLELQGYRKWN